MAISYGAHWSDPREVFVLDADANIIGQSDPIDGIYVVDWLPDSSGIVFNRAFPQGNEPQRPGVYHFEQGFRDLPFDADGIHAVIP